MSDRKNVKIISPGPEQVAGSRRTVRLDPSDERFVLIEDRVPVTFPDQKHEESHGKEALRRQLQGSVGAVVIALSYLDRDLALDVLDAFKAMGVISEDLNIEIPEDPPPS